MRHEKNIVMLNQKKPQHTNQIRISIYVIAFFNLLIVIATWWFHSGALMTSGKQGDMLISLGRITGLLAEFFILVELILVGRITWLEQLFGYDKMNMIHRWIGYGVLIFFIGHPLLSVIGNAEQNGVGAVVQFLNFIHIGEYMRGLIGFLLFLVAVILSYPIAKKKLRYETWYFVHLVMYVAIGLVVGHQTFSETGDVSNGIALYYWFVLNYGIFGVVLAYRWIRPFYLFHKHRFYVSDVKMETESVYSIYVKGKDMSSYAFQAGQYANLNFLQKGMWFTHPFSFSCAPNGEYLRFSVKSLGDFTNTISKIKLGTKVFIDGPMGLFTEAQSITDKYLFIAGGIGITPALSLIQALSIKEKDITLLYANKISTDIAFKEELETLEHNHHFIISDMIDNGKTSYETGRVDREKIKRLVHDVKKRDVYICGPVAMIEVVIQILQEIGVPQKQIHFEKFSY